MQKKALEIFITYIKLTIMIKKLHLKSLLLIAALLVGSSSAWAETVTLTNANIVAAGDADSGYKTWAISDGTNTWNAYAIKNQHSKDTSDKHYLQIKKYASNTAYYIQVPTLGTKITSITMTVSSTSKAMDGGGNTATLYFSASNSTSATGSGVASGTGGSSVTIDCSDLSLNTGYITAGGAVRIWDVTVTYTTNSVSVTGVTVDPTEWTLPVGETKALTATVLPAGATNKTVTWSSNATSVATVNASGVVTAVAEGSATITATTQDGNKTASCAITVTPALLPVVTLNFTTNDWGISENPNKTVDATEFTSGGYTITLEGSSGNGYYFDNNNLMLGKTGATLTLPAFGFNVSKIKVYGTSGASASVTFNIFVGDNAVSTAATSSQVDHDFAIAADKQAVGTVYVIKVTNSNNMRISKIEVFGNGCEAGLVQSYGWATYITTSNVEYPANTAYVVTDASVSAGLTLAEVTQVPANTPLLLKGAGAKTAILLESAPAVPATNLLSIGDGNEFASGSYPYVLAKEGTGACFKQWTGEASALNGRVVLLLNEQVSTRSTYELGEEMTGITGVNLNENQNDNRYYDLQGRPVAQPTKGLYIINGKKVLVK